MGFVKTFEQMMASARASADFYDAEMLAIFWETKPEIVARILPPPLKPAEFPLAMAFVADYPRTNFDVVYKESALFLRAVHNGDGRGAGGLWVSQKDRSNSYGQGERYRKGMDGAPRHPFHGNSSKVNRDVQ
jgi:hypothetical protein